MDQLNIITLLTEQYSAILLENANARRIRQAFARRLCMHSISSYNSILKKRILYNRRVRRSVWASARNSSWWTDTVLGSFNDNEWIENFGVDKITFYEICDIVRTDLEPKPAHLRARDPVCLEKIVATSLHKFATGSKFRVIGNKMGVSSKRI